MSKLYTLVLISQNGKLLLGMKKRGFGEGWWNGFGGKVQEGESVEYAAGREVQEEVGIETKKLIPRGVIYFEFEYEEPVHEVYLFKCAEFIGEPQESEEMKPQWFDFQNLPYDKMWPADKIWIPVYLEGRNISGRFKFSKNKGLLSYNVNEIKTN